MSELNLTHLTKHFLSSITDENERKTARNAIDYRRRKGTLDIKFLAELESRFKSASGNVFGHVKCDDVSPKTNENHAAEAAAESAEAAAEAAAESAEAAAESAEAAAESAEAATEADAESATTTVLMTGTGPTVGKVIPIRKPNAITNANLPGHVAAPTMTVTPPVSNPPATAKYEPSISFEMPRRWVIGHEPENPMEPGSAPAICPRLVAQAAICGLGVLVCTLTLITLQAQAGGGTADSWYWAGLTEIAALILLVYPVRATGFKWFVRVSALRLMGIAFLALGYFVIQTGIAGKTSQVVASAVTSSDEVKDWESEVKRLEREIEPVQKAIEALNPATHPSQIQKFKDTIKQQSEALSVARGKLSAAREQARGGTSVAVAHSWGWVGWLRSAALMVLNTLAGHGMVAARSVLLPVVWMRRTKSK